MKKFLLMLMFFVPAMLFAAIGDNGISVAPDGTQLKWEEGAWDFFIMHKTLVDRVTGAANDSNNPVEKNPQADSFIDPAIGSTYTLTAKHIPQDADVDRAFLVWLTTQDPDNLATPTYNSVTLTFTHATDPEITKEMQVTASFQGSVTTTDQIGNFEYESLYVAQSLTNQYPEAVYTYRVEVSDFMKEIIKMGEAKGMNPGEALYGDYNVKGLNGSTHQNYLTTSGLVGGWFLPFVYTSSHISAKKIYFYNGLAAYRDAAKEITVSGFTLPDEAIIKLGLVVFEGDPGLYSMTFANLEGLSIRGQSDDPTNFAPLFNDCNPLVNNTYTEMYNSISSIFGWGDDSNNYWCSSDPNKLWPIDPEHPLEYAIDADILMVDASPNGPFYGRFNKGDTSFSLKIGANQDQVYTNLLIVSVDTKMPDFDIPENIQTPNGREKDFCSCSTDADAICKDRPFYYTIKIQNHGQNKASGVSLQDTLPTEVKYVPGTTEIATKFDASGKGTDWTAVPDAGDGGFPFANSKEVAAQLDYCRGADNCGEDTTVWVRFVVEPKDDLSKNAVIRNSAIISSYDENSTKYDYYSNSNIPLRLKLGSCPDISVCKLPPKTECGGVRIDNANYCTKDKDCKDGKKCIDNECVLDESSKLTKNAKVSFGVGKNSPDKSSKVIIPNPSQKLVLGQFYLLSEDDADSDKSYKFTTARFQIDKDPNVEIKNFKLYKDENGNGTVDSGDKEIASSASAAEFSISSEHQLTKAGIKNHYLVVADAQSNSTSGQAGAFHMIIEGSASFAISDNGGSITAEGDKIDFVTYEFEPAEGFVFTKGTVTPPVPAFAEFNGEHPILQVRTKAIKINTAIKSIKVKAGGNAYVKFGDGIKSISLYLDKNANGKVDDGETLIQKIEEFENDSTVMFENLKDALKYSDNDEKHLLFQVEFNMQSSGSKAKIQIAQGGVKTTNAKDTIVGLPVASGDFVYECDETDPTSCAVGDDDDSGCAISAISEENNSLYTVAMLLAALFGLLVFRFSRDGKKNR